MSLSEFDRNVGRIALAQQLVRREDLTRVAQSLAGGDGRGDLATLLLQNRLISAQQHAELTRRASRDASSSHRGIAAPPAQVAASGRRTVPSASTSSARPGAAAREGFELQVFVSLLGQRGHLSEDQLASAKRRARPPHSLRSFGTQLIQEGLLASATARQLFNDIRGSAQLCSSCGHCHWDPSGRAPCPRCQQPTPEAPGPGGQAWPAPGMPAATPRPMTRPPPPIHPKTAPTVRGLGGPGSNFSGRPGVFATRQGPPAQGFGLDPSPASGRFGHDSARFDSVPTIPIDGSLSQDSDAPDIFGPYEIEKEIRRGGMGVVYLARRQGSSEVCALKVMLETLNQNAKKLKRFQREVDAHKKLVHPNIVRILDSGKVDEFNFFTMEFIDGQPLDELLKKELDLEIGMEMLEKICRASEYAHSLGVVHRDLKPSNILVTSKMDPKLTDFGLAKSADHVSVLTKTGAVVGTPYYLSPEQASGQSKHVDHRADIYALGVIMYEMITGRLPYTGKTSVELFRKILHDDPIPPTRIKPQLTEEIELVCLHAMEKSPERRYATAGALAKDIAALISGRPISVRKLSRLTLLRKRLRKTGAAPIAIAGLLFLLVTGGGLLAYHHHIETQTRATQRVERLWENYQGRVQAHIEEARRALTVAEQRARMADDIAALEEVNRAFFLLCLSMLEGGFDEPVQQLCIEIGAGPFIELQRQLEERRFDQIKDLAASVGVEIEAAPNEPPKAIRERIEGAHAASANTRRDLEARAFMARGYANIAANDFKAARGDFTFVASKLLTYDATPQVALGETMVAAGDLDAALREYGNALKKDPSAIPAYLGKARALSLTEAYSDALDTLESGLKQAKDDGQKGQCLTTRALITLDYDRATRARVYDRAASAGSAADKALELTPDSARSWLAKAVVSWRTGADVAALKQFARAEELADESTRHDILMARAREFMRSGHLEEALRDARAAGRSTPHHPNNLLARCLVANIHERSLEFDQAKTEAKSVNASVEPRNWRAKAESLQILARLEAYDGRIEDSLTSAEQACQAWPQSSNAQLLLGSLGLLSGRPSAKSVDDSINHANRVIQARGPQIARGKRLKALALARKAGSKREALRNLEDICKRFPADARCRTQLAALLGDPSGPQMSRASRALQRAIESELSARSEEGALLSRAIALVEISTRARLGKQRQKQLTTARRALQKVLFINPLNAHALTFRATLELVNREPETARKTIRRARLANPDFIPALIIDCQLLTGQRGRVDVKPERARESLDTARRLLAIPEELPYEKLTDDQFLPALVESEVELTFRASRAPKLADYQRAAVGYEKLLEFSPRRPARLKRLERLLTEGKNLSSKPKRDELSQKIVAIKAELLRVEAASPARDALLSRYEAMPGSELSNKAKKLDDLVREAPLEARAWLLSSRAELELERPAIAIARLVRATCLEPLGSSGYLAIEAKLIAGPATRDWPALEATALASLTAHPGGRPASQERNLIRAVCRALATVVSNQPKGRATESITAASREQPSIALIALLRSRIQLATKAPERAGEFLSIAYELSGRAGALAFELAVSEANVRRHVSALRLLEQAKNSGHQLSPPMLTPFAETYKLLSERWKALGLTIPSP